MKSLVPLLLLFSVVLVGQPLDKEDRYLFFLHNRWLEEHAETEPHPQFGRAEYRGIVEAFESYDFTVISEQREGDVDVRSYAAGVARQIQGLLTKGVDPACISVVGTSKGGYIAQYVSTMVANPDLNFVFVASFREGDMERLPEIQYCGNILTIRERSDPYAASAGARHEATTCPPARFREVELTTGLGHGFLFRPLPEWIEPTVAWGKERYDF